MKYFKPVNSSKIYKIFGFNYLGSKRTPGHVIIVIVVSFEVCLLFVFGSKHTCVVGVFVNCRKLLNDIN